MKELLIIAISASIGAICRYWVGVWSLARLGGEFPYGTLFVNVSGCFVIGFFMTILHDKIPEPTLLSKYLRLLVVTGFLGSFTTFSAYSYETFALIEKGDSFLAFCNVMLNLIIGFSATWFGICSAKLII